MEWTLGLVLTAYLWPFWAVPWFPTQDGPSHVYNAWVLLHLDAAPYARLYEWRLALVPNWLGTLVLIGAGRVEGVALAEKVLLTVAVVGFTLGFTALVRGDRRTAPPIALLGPMLAFGWPLHMGFYGYALGWAMVPWGWVLARHPTRRRLLSLAFLAVAAWFAHGAAAGMLVLGAGVVATAARRPRVLVALAPGAALVAWELLRLPGEGGAVRWDAARLLETVATLRGLVAYEGVQEWTAGAAAVVILALVARGVARAATPWLIIAAAGLVVYAVLPDGNLRHWFLSERLSLLPWLALCPIAAVPAWPRLQTAVLAGLALTHLGVTLGPQRALSDELASLLSLRENIGPGANVLPMIFDAAPPHRAQVFLHAAGYLGPLCDAVDLGNYEPQTDHFQTRLRAGVTLPLATEVAFRPDRLDLTRWRWRAEYILTRGAPEAVRQRISRHFAAIATHGRHTLFQRRPAEAPGESGSGGATPEKPGPAAHRRTIFTMFVAPRSGVEPATTTTSAPGATSPRASSRASPRASISSEVSANARWIGTTPR